VRVKSVASVPPRAVRSALILAAGNGDRFNNGSKESKLLQPVLGEPLILRTLRTAHAAGIGSFELVVGYRADTLRQFVQQHKPAGVDVHFTYNAQWHLENGVSVLAARARLARQRFALLMGDHLFESTVLERLLRTPIAAGESVLAVDSRATLPEVAAEATKVSLDGSRITAIGKHLTSYDALDTGLFVCDPSLFDGLDHAIAAGDTTLSGGIRHLAERGLMRALDVGESAWYDIDTLADLETAESQLADSATQPEHA
jgi:1L-myo-inositol 1-phosphate cytidylyltransferase